MIAPLVVGKTCDLPHTKGKKGDLDVMADGLSQSLFELKQADLSQLSPEDQLYVYHNAIVKMGGLFRYDTGVGARKTYRYKNFRRVYR